MKDKEVIMRYLKDPELIYKKKLFKDKISKGEVFAEITKNGVKYSGQVDKYTGRDLRLINNSGDVIFTSNKFNSAITLKDKSGNILDNLFPDGSGKLVETFSGFRDFILKL